MPINDDPIFKLQETVSHQTVEIERLSSELIVQGKEIARLRKLVEQLQAMIRDEGIRRPDEETPPPHY